MDGVLNVCKPAGPTSHDVVNSVRRIFSQKRAGHAGTLDPMATGVLVICLGKATRIVEYLTATQKHYRATLTLGVTTDTQDATGSILSEKDASNISIDEIRTAAGTFLGEIEQTPPMISAIKYQGKPLYKHAREGKTIERAPRTVTIYSIEVNPLNSPEGTATTQVELCVKCSSGTYIRTLCADIGDVLGCGGMMSALQRTKVGQFTLDSAVSIPDMERAYEDGSLSSLVISANEALSYMPAIEIDDRNANRIRHGLSFVTDASLAEGSTVRIVSNGALLAIGIVERVDTDIWVRPRKVFVEEQLR
ncbi:MAG: tRNA pseudouridine(55) synthase TruB [Armatimonadota bacterium]